MGYSPFGVDHGGDLFEEVSKIGATAPRVRIAGRRSPRPKNPPPTIPRPGLHTIPKAGPPPKQLKTGPYSGRIGSGFSGNVKYATNAVQDTFKKHPVGATAAVGGVGVAGAGGYAYANNRKKYY